MTDRLEDLAQQLGGAPPLGTCDDVAAEPLTRALARMRAEDVTALWSEWLADLDAEQHDKWVRHMAVARSAVRMPSLSPEQENLLVTTALKYPCPSYNRYFVQACLRQIGLEELMEIYERQVRDALVTLEELDNALYWTRHSESDLSGPRRFSWIEKIRIARTRRRLRKLARGRSAAA